MSSLEAQFEAAFKDSVLKCTDVMKLSSTIEQMRKTLLAKKRTLPLTKKSQLRLAEFLVIEVVDSNSTLWRRLLSKGNNAPVGSAAVAELGNDKDFMFSLAGFLKVGAVGEACDAVNALLISDSKEVVPSISTQVYTILLKELKHACHGNHISIVDIIERFLLHDAATPTLGISTVDPNLFCDTISHLLDADAESVFDKNPIERQTRSMCIVRDLLYLIAAHSPASRALFCSASSPAASTKLLSNIFLHLPELVRWQGVSSMADEKHQLSCLKTAAKFVSDLARSQGIKNLFCASDSCMKSLEGILECLSFTFGSRTSDRPAIAQPRSFVQQESLIYFDIAYCAMIDGHHRQQEFLTALEKNKQCRPFANTLQYLVDTNTTHQRGNNNLDGALIKYFSMWSKVHFFASAADAAAGANVLVVGESEKVLRKTKTMFAEIQNAWKTVLQPHSKLFNVATIKNAMDSSCGVNNNNGELFGFDPVVVVGDVGVGKTAGTTRSRE